SSRCVSCAWRGHIDSCDLSGTESTASGDATTSTARRSSARAGQCSQSRPRFHSGSARLALGTFWKDVDLDDGSVAINWKVIRIRGVGLRRVQKLKTESGDRTLPL